MEKGFMDFKAIAIHRTDNNRRVSGVLHWNDVKDCFEFVRDDLSLDIPLSGIKVSRGGANNQLIFLDSPVQPGWSFYTTDSKILKMDIWNREATQNEQIKKVKKNFQPKLWMLITGGVLVLLVLAVINLWGVAVKFAANQVPREWEAKLGDELLPLVIGKKDIISNDSLTLYLQKAVKPLEEVFSQHEKDLKPQFYVVQNPVVNAFALPGGKVVLHSGLIQKVKSTEELLGVVAHELAHVSERHHLRSLIYTAGIALLAQTLLGDFSAMTVLIHEYASDITILTYSRDQEREADQTGWDFMIQARINPQGMISFFKKLSQEEGTSSLTDKLSILSTHPDTQERIEALTKELKDVTIPESGWRQDLPPIEKIQGFLNSKKHSSRPKKDPKNFDPFEERKNENRNNW